MKKSQHANHVVMEIRNIHVLNHNATEYLYTWTSIEKRHHIREVETQEYSVEFIVTLNHSEFSPSFPWFSQFGFSCKNPLFLSVYRAEIFNYHREIERHFRLWCEIDCPINCVRKSPPQIGSFIEISSQKIQKILIKKPLLDQLYPKEANHQERNIQGKVHQNRWGHGLPTL